MKKILKIALWIVVIGIFAATFYYLWRNSRPEATVYDIVSPTRGDIERTTVLTGSIEPRDEIEIKPQISGIISEINVQAGDEVKVGDVIAKIKVIPDESQLSSAMNRVNTAKISLNDATTRHHRNTALFEKGVISREEWEATLVEVERAREEVSAANEAYAIIKEGIAPGNATASNTLVRATTSGLVLDVPVKVGSSVIQSNTFNDGTTIATIADMNNLIFKGTVDETEVGNLAVGQDMHITVGALPDLNLDAVIEYISPKSTSTSGANTFEIKARLNLPAGTSLRSGYSANAAVTLSSARNVVMVPESVVEFVGDSAWVYVLTDSMPQAFDRRHIVTGLTDGMNIEVKSGIDAAVKLRGAAQSTDATPSHP